MVLLDRCSLGDEGVRVLCPSLPQMRSLEGLDLGNNGVTSRGALQLLGAPPSCQKLLELSLSCNPIGGTCREVGSKIIHSTSL